MSQEGGRADEFTYRDSDCFPIESVEPTRSAVPCSASRWLTIQSTCAAAVATEIARMLREETVRDRKTGAPRSATPGDIAILFRSRASHREFEHELERLGIPTYVYKGLGFFDADEIKDVVALVRYLARSGARICGPPRSCARASSACRIAALARAGAEAGRRADRARAARTRRPRSTTKIAACSLHARGAVVRAGCARVDRVPPADLIEQLLRETAYAYELRGPRRHRRGRT